MSRNRKTVKPAATPSASRGMSRTSATLGRRTVLFGAVAAMGAAGLAYGLWPTEATGAPVLVYKSPSCGCCGDWVSHMRRNGFKVTVVSQEDVIPIKESLGVPDVLQSCHTAVIDDGASRYVLEGHVPAADVRRLLTERPDAIGLAVPGMPVGAPGMEQGGDHDSYQVVLFSRAKRSVYARY